MFNEDGTVAVVFNGEIYNFSQLAERLTSEGHRFKTHSDTEVIVHAWEEYGEQCVTHFRGMFALAVYDLKQRKLFLARDRIGKKPLLYMADADCFVFGSEIKALAQFSRFRRELDLVALGDYVSYGNSIGQRTIYKGVRKLLPGHTLMLDTHTAVPQPIVAPFWQFRFDTDFRPSNSEWLDRLDEVLSEAVRLRLVSDVPLGAFLSGGIDSSLVVAMMARHCGHRVKTFTIGFDVASHDESTHAAAVARHLDTDHHVEYVRPDALEVLDHLIDAYDEPFADSSSLPTYYLSKITRQHVTVALSGDGGDELFGGYARYPWAWRMDLAGKFATPVGRWVAGRVANSMEWGRRAKWILEKIATPGSSLYTHIMGRCPDTWILLNSELRDEIANSWSDKLVEDFHRHDNLSTAERYQFVDLMNYLPDDILVKVDRASMYHSLEVRCPFLDNEFVELTARIPQRLKIRASEGKWILKRLAYRYVPREILDRPKKGFSVPLNKWFRGELAPIVDEMLTDSTSPMWDYFDRAVVKCCVRQHLNRRPEMGALLWRLLYFHRWCAKHLA